MMDQNSDGVIRWLLEEGQPSLQLRTWKELLDADDEMPEVRRLKSILHQSIPVRDILDKMHPDGYWLQKNPRTNKLVGDGVEYGSFASTHFCLSYLAELGLDRAHPQVSLAAERYLNLQQLDGDWLGHYSCLFGYNIRTFVRLGYGEDEHVKRALDLMLATVREDGGYLCDFHKPKGKKFEKSCIRGSVKCLLALMELPETWDHPRCKQLIDYFLRRGGIYKSTHPELFVNMDMERLSFPITWRTNIWEILLALGKMGYGDDERLSSAWAELDRRADETGRYRLDWTPTECPWKVGKRDEVNKWVTFYSMLAKKYRNPSPS